MITNYNESQSKQSDNKGLTLNVITMHLEEKEMREAILCFVNGVTIRHIYVEFFFFLISFRIYFVVYSHS